MKVLLLLFYLIFSFLAKCQIQLSFDSSRLIKGTGKVFIISEDGKKFGFITYKNGHMDGEYYVIDTSGQFELKGQVKYSPSCIYHQPGIEVNYVSENNDTISVIVDSISFEKMYRIPTLRILSLNKVSTTVTVTGIHPELGFNFGESAVVPIGKWQYFNLKENYVFKQYNFDECGNIITSQLFNAHGVLIKQLRYKKQTEKKIFWH